MDARAERNARQHLGRRRPAVSRLSKYFSKFRVQLFALLSFFTYITLVRINGDDTVYLLALRTIDAELERLASLPETRDFDYGDWNRHDDVGAKF